MSCSFSRMDLTSLNASQIRCLSHIKALKKRLTTGHGGST